MKIKIEFRHFTFVGTIIEIDAYGIHLESERKRYSDKKDVQSVRQIDKELRIVKRVQSYYKKMLTRSRTYFKHSYPGHTCPIASKIL
ncbi:MAG TPA: hypothetical protein VGB67_01570 [Fibrella sp.]|jgi:hypothetical protein